MAQSKADTSASALNPTQTSPYAPANLFQLVPGVEMVWVVSQTDITVQAGTQQKDEMPQGEYIILKVTSQITDKPGFYQVPPPPRSSKGRVKEV